MDGGVHSELRAAAVTPMCMCRNDVTVAQPFKWPEPTNPEGRLGEDERERNIDDGKVSARCFKSL